MQFSNIFSTDQYLWRQLCEITKIQQVIRHLWARSWYKLHWTRGKLTAEQFTQKCDIGTDCNNEW